MSLTVLPLLSKRMEGEFDVFEILFETLEKNNEKLQEGDVIVISTKFISNSQGRIMDLPSVKPSVMGKEISEIYQLKPQIAEIIIRESDKIFGGIGGFVITSSDNIMAPNAGIDKSNAKKDKIISRVQKEKPRDKTWELRPIFGDLMWAFDKWNIL